MYTCITLYFKEMFFIRGKKKKYKNLFKLELFLQGKLQHHVSTISYFWALNLIKPKPGLRLTCVCVNYNMNTLLVKHGLNGRYSHSHQLNFKLDWSGIELRLAQVVLTFLWEEDWEKECDRRGDTSHWWDTETSLTLQRSERFIRRCLCLGWSWDAHAGWKSGWRSRWRSVVTGRTHENLGDVKILMINDQHCCEAKAKRTFS